MTQAYFPKPDGSLTTLELLLILNFSLNVLSEYPLFLKRKDCENLGQVLGHAARCSPWRGFLASARSGALTCVCSSRWCNPNGFEARQSLFRTAHISPGRNLTVSFFFGYFEWSPEVQSFHSAKRDSLRERISGSAYQFSMGVGSRLSVCCQIPWQLLVSAPDIEHTHSFFQVPALSASAL
jgi:hypothetical protein